jgi:hypothetical protein
MLLSGCGTEAPTFSVPEQRPEFQDASHWQRVIHMLDADAPEHFLRDISPHLDGSWRWGARKPALKLRALRNENLVFFAEFALPEGTFRSTGPVSISFRVNERLLDRVRYETAGSHTFEMRVPAEWITPGEDVTLGMEPDKAFLDGDKVLGVILVSIGLQDVGRETPARDAKGTGRQ